MEGDALAGPLLEGELEGLDGLLEALGAALALAEGPQRSAQVHLGHGPLEGYALAGGSLKDLAIALDG